MAERGLTWLERCGFIRTSERDGSRWRASPRRPRHRARVARRSERRREKSVSDSRGLEHDDAGSTGGPNREPVHDALERLEWHDAKREETPHSRLAAFTRRTALTGGAAG